MSLIRLGGYSLFLISENKQILEIFKHDRIGLYEKK